MYVSRSYLKHICFAICSHNLLLIFKSLQCVLMFKVKKKSLSIFKILMLDL